MSNGFVKKYWFSHLNTLHNEVIGLDLVLFWWHFKMNFKHDVCSFKYLEGVHFEKRFFFESRKSLAKKNICHWYFKRLCISSTLLRRVFLECGLTWVFFFNRSMANSLKINSSLGIEFICMQFPEGTTHVLKLELFLGFLFRPMIFA